MNLKRLIALAAAVSLTLSGCAGAGRPETPPPGAAPGPALWKVADEDTTIYLFGTVHRLPADSSWFDGRIARAFEASDEFVTEIDMSDPQATARVLTQAGALPEGQNLREQMSVESRRKYEAALVSLGLPVEIFDRFKPWYAALLLSAVPAAQAGFTPDGGAENALGSRAAGKKRSALESPEQQIALFDSLAPEAQMAFLEGTLDELPNFSNSLNAMLTDWAEGDAERLQELIRESDPAMAEALLARRNTSWAQWIKNRMEQPGTVFMAVGAGHLAGKGSVQSELRKHGLKARRVWE